MRCGVEQQRGVRLGDILLRKLPHLEAVGQWCGVSRSDSAGSAAVQSLRGLQGWRYAKQMPYEH